MKRVACFILAVCLMCAAAVSCSDGEAGPLGVIFYGSEGDTFGVDLSVWKRSLLENHEEEGAPKTAVIEILGKEFTGEYQYSSVFYPSLHMSHIYTGEYCTFSVNAETGGLDSFNVAYEKTDKTFTEEQCRSTAEKIAAKYIDLKDYTSTVTKTDDKYFFRYTKYVEGLPTKDMLNVGISIYTGGFCTLGNSLAGSFEVSPDTERAIRRLKAADKEGILRDKVASLFDGEYEWSHDDYVACCLPGGTVALYTKVTVSTMLEDEADGEKYTYPSVSDFDAYIFEIPDGYVPSGT